MQALLDNGFVEWMEDGLLPLPWYLDQPYQQQHQQMAMDWFYSPLSPMTVALPPSYSPADLPLSMDQSLTNLPLQHKEPMNSFLLSQKACDLVLTRERRIMQLETLLSRAEEERETIANEVEQIVGSLDRILKQIREPFIHSSPDAGDAASCSGKAELGNLKNGDEDEE